MTLGWEIIFAHPQEWKENYRHFIKDNKQRNSEIKRLFEEKLYVVFKPIDFFWFFRNEREDTFDDVFGGNTREDMIAKGYRDIDLDLYVAVNKFDFKESERLLKHGANPACVITDEGSSCFDRIGAECCFLEIGLQEIFIKRERRNPIADNTQDQVNLIGWAAHENMYSRYT